MAISQIKLDQVGALFAVVPDSLFRRLERVLAEAQGADPSLEPVLSVAKAERRARDLAATVFEPLLPLTEPARAPKRRLIEPMALARALRAAEAVDPALVARAAAAPKPHTEDPAPPEYDTLCRRAAEATPPSADGALEALLRLVPQLRAARLRLHHWIDNLNGDNVAALRLAFKDAIAVDENCGPLFWEALFTYLDQPWQVVRLISAVLDRPSDRYLAESELASLGERLLGEIDARIGDLKRFDPAEGEAAGAGAAEKAALAFVMIAEFEEWLALRKDGPWGARLSAQKQAATQAMEARLREVEPAVAAALPLLAKPGRGGRPIPKLTADPEPLLVVRAEALLTLLDGSRTAAQAGGFASLRAKVVEAVQQRLEPYCEDLLDTLHRKDSEDPERVRAYLEAASRIIALVQGPQAAQIVRRRAAAA